jgi:hypothetical protein
VTSTSRSSPAPVEDIAYFQPYAEEDAPIQRYVADRKDPRYGLPLFYTVTRSLVAQQGGSLTGQAGYQAGKALPVHYSRVLHVSDGLLDDMVFGEPALRCVWNRLDDLEKISGGGAEAFWKRADQGLQVDIDPLMKLKDGEIEQIKKDVDEYVNGLKRVLRTRGIKINPLGSDVANFDPQVKSIIGLISAGTGIPQRILLGSEQAKLAAEQDGDNWDERVAARREEYADPCIVHPFIDWMTRLGVLPEVEEYESKWELAKKANVAEQAEIAKALAAVNNSAGETVFTADEIRSVLGYGTQKEAGIEVDDNAAPAPKAAPQVPPTPKAASSGKGGASFRHVHQAADRFRPNLKAAAKKAFRAGKAAVSRSTLTAALDARSQADATAAMQPGIDAFKSTFLGPYRAAMTAIVAQSGTQTIKRLKLQKQGFKASAKATGKTSVSIDLVFDKTNPSVIDWIEQHTLEGVDDIAKTTKDEVGRILAKAFDEQLDTKDVFDELVSAIGDETRADLIARTESMIAANEGQAEAWDQAVDDGLLTGKEQKTWIVADDNALCPICDGLADQTVALDDNFESPDTGEEFDQPPAHPRCRCTTGLVG